VAGTGQSWYFRFRRDVDDDRSQQQKVREAQLERAQDPEEGVVAGLFGEEDDEEEEA
jgi:hypothetical protein